MDELDCLDQMNISFPRIIGRNEARTLLRHLVFSMPANCCIDLRIEASEHLGERLRDRSYRNKDEVRVTSGDYSLSGVILDEHLTSAEFTLSKTHDKCHRLAYDSLRLSFGAYDWDEISERERQLVANLRTRVQAYFNIGSKKS